MTMAARERAAPTPLYVSGKRAGFCSFGGQDVLGGWVTGVAVAFLLTFVFVAVVFAASGAQARVAEDRRAWVERRSVGASSL
jgi:hypothetical protein